MPRHQPNLGSFLARLLDALRTRVEGSLALAYGLGELSLSLLVCNSVSVPRLCVYVKKSSLVRHGGEVRL